MIWLAADPEFTAGTQGMTQDYTMDGTPVHCRKWNAHCHNHLEFSISTPLTSMYYFLHPSY